MTLIANTNSEDEMIAAGLSFGVNLSPGSVVALVGQLGAGKTHFTKGIARSVGSSDLVTSPTFGLVNEYRSGSVPVFHFDFYRMDEAEEVIRIGWEEYLEEDGILVVEWADKFEFLLPEETLWLHLEISADGVHTVSQK